MSDPAEYRRAAIEVMAEAAKGHVSTISKIVHREHTAEVMLDALLAATQDEPCATCGGDGFILRDNIDGEGFRSAAYYTIKEDCPDCTNGRVPGAPLVLLGPEQVAWLGPYGVIPGGMDNEPVPAWKPLYRSRGQGQ